MKIEYLNSFLKDLKKLKKSDRKAFDEVKRFAFEEIEQIESFPHIPQLIKLTGYSNYYRIKIKDYRIGITYSENTLVFVRILPRKEIYKYFP